MLPFINLRRPRGAATDDPEQGPGPESEPGSLLVADPDATAAEPTAADAEPAADDSEAAAADGDGPADDEVIDITDGATASRRTVGRLRLRRRSDTSGNWFGALVGALQLRSDLGSALAAPAAVGVAVVWATGWVLALSILGAAAAGIISGGPVLRLDLFIDAVRLANLMPVASGVGPVSLVPMLPAMAVLALLVHAGNWLMTRLGGRPGAPYLPGGGLAVLAVGYLLIMTLVATSPTADAGDGPLTQGLPAMLAIVVLGTGSVAARHLMAPAAPRLWLLVRAAATVLTVILAAALLVLMAALLGNWSEFWDMSAQLLASGTEPASRFDAAALGALQLAYLPNAVVWTASYLLGAGFSVGEATIVSPFSVTVGTLPELPLTVLLPEQAMRWPWIPLLVVAVGSVLAGALIRNVGLAQRMRTRVVVAASLAVLSAVGMAFLAAASNGGLGPGRLAAVGPHPLSVLLATLIVVGLGQLAWALFPTLAADVGPFVEHAGRTARTARTRRAGRRARAAQEKSDAARAGGAAATRPRGRRFRRRRG